MQNYQNSRYAFISCRFHTKMHIIVQIYSNQVYIMLQLLNYSKTIQKHIDIKDINVSMINRSYIKIQLLIYTNT